MGHMVDRDPSDEIAAVIELLGRQLSRHNGEVAASFKHLRRYLISQIVIEQAKGMLMMLHDWEAERAFAALDHVYERTTVQVNLVASVLVASSSPTPHIVQDEQIITAVLAELRLL